MRIATLILGFLIVVGAALAQTAVNGYFIFVGVGEPPAPASGRTAVYVDSSTGKLCFKASSGAKNCVGDIPGAVTSVSGTANEISSTGGTAPIIGIDNIFRITGKTATAPVKTGTTLPATCQVGDLFFKTDSREGENLYGCTSANTWSLQAVTRVINYTLFDPSNDLLPSMDIPSIFVNLGSRIRLLEVYCEIDAGSASINLQRDDGSPANILSSNLNCSPAGGSTNSFVAGENVIDNGHRIDHVTVSVSGARRMNIAIRYQWY